jgi:hypothetical protein
MSGFLPSNLCNSDDARVIEALMKPPTFQDVSHFTKSFVLSPRQYFDTRFEVANLRTKDVNKLVVEENCMADELAAAFSSEIRVERSDSDRVSLLES